MIEYRSDFELKKNAPNIGFGGELSEAPFKNVYFL